ncbi:unnamed protein product [Rotaria socialis]|uniref:Craniofacial development protein 1 n=1 Tax=Rotaria socialis TaxID=392032 RepID=A0A817LUI7_9BILA|nr:unnamed protein product [Rotaria socialis]CAF3439908.1 unnamed protein product [Rotaria socialis]CAF3638331.1 unnamed protein product [Rotaria socialis]CAF4119789.1 unnamed protein product [Rotaria socialis]CAF4260650.1 unnamed protein product [Rotaria socialis]
MSKNELVSKKVNLDDDDVDDDDDDDDYCPTKNQNEQSDPSDESDPNDDDDDNVDGTTNSQDQQTDNKKKDDTLNITPYDASKTDQLWRSFASSTKSLPSSTANNSAKTITTTEIPKPQVQTPKPIVANKILEFAGEKISVPVTTIAKESTESASLKRPAPSLTGSNSVLDRLGIGKKQKLSTLEKSRLDWDSHKASESLKDDLDSHRRGKDSYVEKKAFLQRTEIREHDNYLAYVKKK